MSSNPPSPYVQKNLSAKLASFWATSKLLSMKVNFLKSGSTLILGDFYPFKKYFDNTPGIIFHSDDFDDLYYLKNRLITYLALLGLVWPVLETFNYFYRRSNQLMSYKDIGITFSQLEEALKTRNNANLPYSVIFEFSYIKDNNIDLIAFSRASNQRNVSLIASTRDLSVVKTSLGTWYSRIIITPQIFEGMDLQKIEEEVIKNIIPFRGLSNYLSANKTLVLDLGKGTISILNLE